MTKHKYHTWFRMPSIQESKKNTFFCRHPSCYKKASLNVLHHKIAECTVCGNTFILDISTIKEDMISINCPHCLGIEVNPETKLLDTLKTESTSFLSVNFDRLKEKLTAKELELQKRENRLIQKEEKLEVQRKRHFDILIRHRNLYARRRNELLALRENIERREKQLKLLEQTNSIDQEVLADSILTIFKKLEEHPHESDGSLKSE